MKIDNFDVLIYKKSDKYTGVIGVNRREKSSDILKKITGLEALDGAVVLTKNNNAVFVDGRYIEAAKKTVDYKKFEILNLDIDTIINWIEKKSQKNSKIAYDPRFFTHKTIKKIKNSFPQSSFECVDLEKILGITTKKRELHIHRINRFFSEEKLSNIYDMINKNNLDAYLLCDPCAISWALNIRDLDSEYCPVVLGFLVAAKDRSVTLYIDDLYNAIPKNDINIKFEHELLDDLKKFKSVGMDESETPSHLQHENFIYVKNPCALQKSIKNNIEISDIKSAAKKDSVAIINFLHWLSSYKSSITELEVAEQTLYFRKLQEGFIGESFPCISAADENSALPHYSPNIKHNKVVQNILLLDSGGQYKYGTTDITRTICLNETSDEQKMFYTLVLKGHIAIANAKFPIGTTGMQLDSLARQYLWNHSSNYDHGTGHGIGYMLNVHEGPMSISKTNSVPLQSGMILTNEPAYYKENSFGVRLENMILVKKEERSEFLSFETISLAPFDVNFIDKKLLNNDEICWINTYHNRIVDELKEYLDSEVLNWLKTWIL